MKVVVYQNDDSHVVEGVDVDGVSQEFTLVKIEQKLPVPFTVVTELCPALQKDASLRHFFHTTRDAYVAAVPWAAASVAPGGSFADCCTYVLPATVLPKENSFFPVNWRYASGFTLIEIEPFVDATTGTQLSAEFFLSKQFTEKLESLQQSLRGLNNLEDIPGFVLADTVKHFFAFADAGGCDPLLKCYNPQFVRTSKLKLQQEDFIALCVSEWSRVSQETASLAGHTNTTRHYYILCKYSLPVESVDQLKMLLYLNPHSDAWEKFITRKPFERAAETAEQLRLDFINKALRHLSLQPKRSNPHPTHTNFDVFDDHIVNVNVRNNGEDVPGVTFFSGCTPTHRSSRGIVMHMGADKQDGFLWLHGPSSARIGGESWKQPLSVNGLPVTHNVKLSKKSLNTFTKAGWNENWGLVKVEPIQFV